VDTRHKAGHDGLEQERAMKAFRFHQTGGPEVLRFEDVDVGDPEAGQVRMRNTAVAVNYRDILMRRGQHTVSLPSGIGIESAGAIEAVGPDVKEFKIGDRVACVAGPDSAYAQARIVPVARVVALPDGIDERTAAAMMIRGMTARYLLHATFKVKPGDMILVHAAAGGVGTILCQWAKHLGATVIGTVGNDEKAAFARAHGCEHPIVYTREDFAECVRAITDGKGVPVVYDSIGRTTFDGSLRSLARRGVLASYGEASGDPDPVPPRRLGQLGSVFLTHPSLGDYTATRAELTQTANDLFAMVTSGKIKIEVSQAYPLHDAPHAQADLEARRTTGSIVLIP
jgi:NADPH2:quinone reductase